MVSSCVWSHGSRTRVPPKAVTRARFQKRTGDLQSVHTEVLGAFGDTPGKKEGQGTPIELSRI